ncbi:MAG: GGDEF domain-containing protein [Planctomycetota bacterium]|nr:MAG: GGDEF domain-containing protein [Planctomycetota bacterium]
MGASDSSSHTDACKILLVGDIGRAFLDTDAARRLPCEIHGNISDAIDAAAKNNFTAVAVVISGTAAKLNSDLKSLRAASASAKIVLLAQMHQEPLAIQLVGSTFNGAALADDYLVCPVQAGGFYESVVSTRPRPKVELPAAPPVARPMDARIKQLEKLATEDDLTGLKNRRYIWEFARQIIEHARKENGRVTLLIFDIDNFKHYNDVYGHSAGDEILKQAAVLMQRSCRAHDVVGRIGGDEFAAVFWDDPRRKALAEQTERRSAAVDHPREAIFVAKRFRKELGKAELHLLGPEGKGVLTISGGLASFPRDGSTMQQLFRQADTALLDAKRSGKNRIYLVGRPKSDIADVE